MIYAAPGATFTAVAEGFSTGLVGTITVQIERSDGTTHTAATTAGIVELEASSGAYAKDDLTAPTVAGTYVVMWAASGTFASEELIVASSAPSPTSLAGTSPRNFGDLRARVDELAGFDLDTTYRDTLLNDGHRELAVRSEWYRAEVELGPTTEGERRYDVSDEIVRILGIQVGGYEYVASDRNEVARLDNGRARLLNGVDGLWWDAFSASNQKQVGIYPTPAAGTSLSALCITRPPLMENDEDVPVVPEEQRPAIVDYAAAIYFGAVEDNPELRRFHQDEFDRKVAELRRLITATGRAPTGWKVS